DRNSPPVPQINAQGILGETHIGNTFVSRQRQDAHARPPRIRPDVESPASESAATPWARNRSYARARPAATRTWPKNRPYRHGHGAVNWVRGWRSRSGTGRFARPSAWVIRSSA